MQVASGRRDGKGFRTGQEVKHRLLLNRVNLQRGNVAPGDLKLPILVVAELANTSLSWLETAGMRASQAAHNIFLQVFGKLSGSGILVQMILKPHIIPSP